MQNHFRILATGTTMPNLPVHHEFTFAPNPTCCSNGKALCPSCQSLARRDLLNLEEGGYAEALSHTPRFAPGDTPGYAPKGTPPDPYRAATVKALSADVPDEYDRTSPPDGYAIAVARMRKGAR